MSDLEVLVLAAGESKRMGCAKQLLQKKIEGQQTTLLGYCVNTVSALGLPVTVVLGANGEACSETLQGLPVEIRYNPVWNKGLSGSLKVGLESLDRKAVLIVLADQPLLTTEFFWQLYARWRLQPERIVASSYDDKQGGVPAIFPSPYLSELCALEGDQGARKIIAAAENVVLINADGLLIDIDTPEQASSHGWCSADVKAK